jgi:hypothetical protein
MIYLLIINIYVFFIIYYYYHFMREFILIEYLDVDNNIKVFIINFLKNKIF